MSDSFTVMMLLCCPQCSNPYLSNFDGKEEAKQHYIKTHPNALLCTGNQSEKTCVPTIVSLSSEERKYWDIQEEKGLLKLLDPDKHMHVYIKWDGDVHIWYYEDSPLKFDHDTGLDRTDYGFGPGWQSDLYRIIDIDEEIARLQQLRAIAVKWFDEHRNQRWPPDLLNLDANSIRADEPAWNDHSREDN